MQSLILADLPASGNVEPALDAARWLARSGVPVFACCLAQDGRPLRSGWQHTGPDPALVDEWAPGMALCAVTGEVFDVLDVDPRNGGEPSLARLQALLGAGRPRIYARSATPSGGRHYWLAALHIGKHVNWWPGLDLQGARADGSGRSLAFLPPTVRPSKVTGELLPYRWLESPQRVPQQDTSGAGLAAVIGAAISRETRPAGRATVAAVPSTAPYVRAALTAELERVAAAADGTRNTALNRAAYALGRFVAEGKLDGAATEDALISAAEHAGLAYPEAAATIRSAFTARGAA